MDENILRRFIENPAQAVKLSQVGVITPVYSEGRVYAVNMGLPFCVFELPENERSLQSERAFLSNTLNLIPMILFFATLNVHCLK